jgi:hypothetical protein
MTCWTLKDLLDEYFGMLYYPQRAGDRFSPNIKQQIIKRVTSKIPDAETFFKSPDLHEFDFMFEEDEHGLQNLLNLMAVYGYKDPEEALDYLTSWGLDTNDIYGSFRNMKSYD